MTLADSSLDEATISEQSFKAMVAVDTADGRHVLPVEFVRAVNGPDIAITCKRKLQTHAARKILTVDVGAERANQPSVVWLQYLTKGLRWTPTYRVGLAPAQGDLSFTAETVNEVEDIEDAAFDFVVGVPTFAYDHWASELCGAPLVDRRDKPRRNSEEAAFASASAPADFRRGADVVNLSADLAYSSQQDHFVYSVPKLSLKKGARCAIPLWHNVTPLRHIYSVEMTLTRDKGAMDPIAGEVWHRCELLNGSSMPWAAGAALLMQGNLPLGQHKLVHTAVGTKCVLPVSVAMDLQAKLSEEEVARKEVVPQSGHSGPKVLAVRSKCVLKIKNRRRQPATTHTKLGVTGRVGLVPAGWAVSVGVGTNLNPTSVITCETELAAGATLELQFDREFLVTMW